MNKKNYISIFTFILLFIIGFIYLNKVFKSTHFYNNTIEDFVTLSKKTNIDVIFYGSSYAYTAYNPSIFNNHCKTISYNLGSSSLRLPFTEMVFEESLKYTKPKLIVIEVNRKSIKLPNDKNNIGIQLRAFDFVSNLSFNKIKKIIELKNISFEDAMFPLLRNHNKWFKRSFSTLNRRKNIDYYYNYYYNGFVSTNNEIKDSIRIKKFRNFKDNSGTKFNITKNDSLYLNRIIYKIKKYGIDVLFLSSPTLETENSNYFTELKCFFKKQNINYINLNSSEIGLKINDFRDISHLNNFGSFKTSKFLAKYINSNFTLPNREKEKVWQKSNEEYQFFNKLLNNNKHILTKKTNLKLTKSITINKINISRSFNNCITKLYLTKKDSLLKLNDYKLAVHVYPIKEELNLLRDSSKKEKRKFDLNDVYIKNTIKNNVITLNFTTKIKHIDYIELYLYDKKGYFSSIIKIDTINLD